MKSSDLKKIIKLFKIMGYETEIVYIDSNKYYYKVIINSPTLYSIIFPVKKGVPWNYILKKTNTQIKIRWDKHDNKRRNSPDDG